MREFDERQALMSPRKKTSSAVTFVDVVAAARKLPEIEVSKSYGTPSIKVRGKMPARLQEDGETLVLRTDFLARQILTQADPAAFRAFAARQVRRVLDVVAEAEAERPRVAPLPRKHP